MVDRPTAHLIARAVLGERFGFIMPQDAELLAQEVTSQSP